MRGTLIGLLSALLVAGIVACPPSPRPPPAPMDDAGEPLVEEPDTADGAVLSPECRAACARLRELGCPEAMAIDGGATCYRVCVDAQKSGKFDLKPRCIASARTVVDLRLCGTVRCRE